MAKLDELAKLLEQIRDQKGANSFEDQMKKMNALRPQSNQSDNTHPNTNIAGAAKLVLSEIPGINVLTNELAKINRLFSTLFPGGGSQITNLFKGLGQIVPQTLNKALQSISSPIIVGATAGFTQKAAGSLAEGAGFAGFNKLLDKISIGGFIDQIKSISAQMDDFGRTFGGIYPNSHKISAEEWKKYAYEGGMSEKNDPDWVKKLVTPKPTITDKLYGMADPDKLFDGLMNGIKELGAMLSYTTSQLSLFIGGFVKGFLHPIGTLSKIGSSVFDSTKSNVLKPMFETMASFGSRISDPSPKLQQFYHNFRRRTESERRFNEGSGVPELNEYNPFMDILGRMSQFANKGQNKIGSLFARVGNVGAKWASGMGQNVASNAANVATAVNDYSTVAYAGAGLMSATSAAGAGGAGAGGGAAVTAAGGGAAGAGLVVGSLVAALVTIPILLAGFGIGVVSITKTLFESQRKLAEVSGGMAAAFALHDVREMLRNMRSGNARASSTNALMVEYDKFMENIRPLLDAIYNIVADTLTVLLRVFNYISDVFKNLMEHLAPLIEWLTSNPLLSSIGIDSGVKVGNQTPQQQIEKTDQANRGWVPWLVEYMTSNPLLTSMGIRSGLRIDKNPLGAGAGLAGGGIVKALDDHGQAIKDNTKAIKDVIGVWTKDDLEKFGLPAEHLINQLALGHYEEVKDRAFEQLTPLWKR